jgi:hypothetical protein
VRGRFEFNTRKVLFAFGLPLAVLLACALYVFVPIWLRVSSAQSQPLRVAQSNVLNELAVATAVCLVATVIAVAVLIRNVARTEISEAGVTKQGMFGRTHIEWSAVVAVHLRNGAVRLTSPAGSIFIPVKYYRRPEAVLAFINEMLSALPVVRE